MEMDETSKESYGFKVEGQRLEKSLHQVCRGKKGHWQRKSQRRV